MKKYKNINELRSYSAFLRVLALVFIVLLSGCGYRFVGGGDAPKGMQTIYIHLIENRTAEVGIEIVLTDQLKNEFISKYKGQLAPLDQADGILSGRITDVRSVTVARRGTQSSLEQRVTITIDLTLKNQDDDIVWFTRGMSGSETFAVEQSDRQLTETAKQDAMELVLRRLAQEVYYRMTDDF